MTTRSEQSDSPVGKDTVVYAARDGYRPLELDVYTPQGVRSPVPLVVMLHGGGWLRGSRRSFGPRFDVLGWSVFERVARAGHVVASVDYRLSGEDRFPAQLDGVLDALGWLCEHADDLGMDVGRTVLWGESAGGHLASLAALRHTEPTDDLTADRLQVRGVIAWYAPSDLSTMGRQARTDAVANAEDADSRESSLLGSRPSQAGERAFTASPARQVHRAAPPFLLVHGTEDRAVPYQQSVQLHDALVAAGLSSRLELVPGGDHMWVGVEDLEPLLTMGLQFAQSVCR